MSCVFIVRIRRSMPTFSYKLLRIRKMPLTNYRSRQQFRSKAYDFFKHFANSEEVFAKSQNRRTKLVRSSEFVGFTSEFVGTSGDPLQTCMLRVRNRTFIYDFVAQWLRIR